MMTRTDTRWSLIALLTISAAAVAGGPGHSDDLTVGRSAAGQLKVESAIFAELPFPLPAVSGLLNGWALDEPGVLSLTADEPEEDFFQLAPGADVVLEIVSIDPALKVHTPGFADILDTGGETWNLGVVPFHEHPTCHIDSDDAGFSPGDTEWQVTFRFVDQGTTGYSPSVNHTIIFTNVQPAPAASTASLIVSALALVAAGAMAIGFQHGRN